MNKYLRYGVIAVVIGIFMISGFQQLQGNRASGADGLNQVVSDLPIGTSKGNLAPNFVAETLSGETIQISDFRGEIVVVNLFASWCGPCRIETPHLVQVSLANDDVVFLGLNKQEDAQAVEGYRDDFVVPYQLILNKDGKLGELYPERGLPTTWFLDANGVVQYVHAGPMTSQMLEGVLEDIRIWADPDPFSE